MQRCSVQARTLTAISYVPSNSSRVSRFLHSVHRHIILHTQPPCGLWSISTCGNVSRSYSIIFHSYHSINLTSLKCIPMSQMTHSTLRSVIHIFWSLHGDILFRHLSHHAPKVSIQHNHRRSSDQAQRMGWRPDWIMDRVTGCRTVTHLASSNSSISKLSSRLYASKKALRFRSLSY